MNANKSDRLDCGSEEVDERAERVASLLAWVRELVRDHIWKGTLFVIFLGFGLLLVKYAYFAGQVGEQGKRRLYGYLLEELGTALLVSGTAAGLIHFFVVTYYDQFRDRVQQFLEEDIRGMFGVLQDQVAKRTDAIAADIQGQTRYLVRASAALDAMNKAGISRVYASRASASEDIAKDLTGPDVSQIYLLGISLNDFVRGDQPALHEAWRIIEQYIRGERSIPKQTLDIKVLIIDPECEGAQLRSRAESRAPVAIAGRLYTDVMSTIRHLAGLEAIARERSKKTNVTFEFRLYRLTPILFLCRTESVSYVQPYYFWSSRYALVPIPVLRFESTSSHTLHKEMQDHFDWIWRYASTSAAKFVEGRCIGVDKGLYQANVTNIFSDPQEARARILWLLKHAKRRVCIQGISLHSFFDFGDIFATIQQLAQNGNVKIKVLLLDPRSEQAIFRSFREYLFIDPEMDYEQYRAKGLHHESRLFRDTMETLENIEIAITPWPHSNFHVKLYASAPACFLLIVDDVALVEQYHYGKILPEGHEGFPTILGKDMPLVEYACESRDLFDVDPLRNPFRMLENHFDFVFEKCAYSLSESASLHGLSQPTE